MFAARAAKAYKLPADKAHCNAFFACPDDAPAYVQVERCKAVAAAKHMKAAATVSGHQHRRQQQQQHNADGSAEKAQPAAAAAAAAGGGGNAAAGPGKTAGYNVAYVGNIAFEAGPDDLKALFAECAVTKVIGEDGRP
jgi:hypothetical protein